MKRPSRTIKRESTVLLRGRPLVLIVPPTADVILIRPKGTRTAFEVDALTIYHVAAKLRARTVKAEKLAKRKAYTLKAGKR
jgi:hypothetical protein